jgi:hypothetical protein
VVIDCFGTPPDSSAFVVATVVVTAAVTAACTIASTSGEVYVRLLLPDFFTRSSPVVLLRICCLRGNLLGVLFAGSSFCVDSVVQVVQCSLVLDTLEGSLLLSGSVPGHKVRLERDRIRSQHSVVPGVLRCSSVGTKGSGLDCT